MDDRCENILGLIVIGKFKEGKADDLASFEVDDFYAVNNKNFEYVITDKDETKTNTRKIPRDFEAKLIEFFSLYDKKFKSSTDDHELKDIKRFMDTHKGITDKEILYINASVNKGEIQGVYMKKGKISLFDFGSNPSRHNEIEELLLNCLSMNNLLKQIREHITLRIGAIDIKIKEKEQEKETWNIDHLKSVSEKLNAALHALGENYMVHGRKLGEKINDLNKQKQKLMLGLQKTKKEADVKAFNIQLGNVEKQQNTLLSGIKEEWEKKIKSENKKIIKKINELESNKTELEEIKQEKSVEQILTKLIDYIVKEQPERQFEITKPNDIDHIKNTNEPQLASGEYESIKTRLNTELQDILPDIQDNAYNNNSNRIKIYEKKDISTKNILLNIKNTWNGTIFLFNKIINTNTTNIYQTICIYFIKTLHDIVVQEIIDNYKQKPFFNIDNINAIIGNSYLKMKNYSIEKFKNKPENIGSVDLSIMLRPTGFSSRGGKTRKKRKRTRRNKKTKTIKQLLKRFLYR